MTLFQVTLRFRYAVSQMKYDQIHGSKEDTQEMVYVKRAKVCDLCQCMWTMRSA